MTEQKSLAQRLMQHDYNGICPDFDNWEARDPQCEACRLLETVEFGYEIVQANEELGAALVKARQAAARAWSFWLEAAMNDRLDDGTPVLKMVFMQNPELAQRLSEALGLDG